MSHKILTCPSFDLENKIIEGGHGESLYKFWQQMIDTASNFKNSVFIAIPNNLRPYFFNDLYLKLIHEKLVSSTQFNIGFHTLKKIDGCVNDSYDELYALARISNCTAEFLTALLHYGKFPFLISDVDGECKKESCDVCGRGLDCGAEYCLSQLSVGDFDAIRNKISDVAKLQFDCNVRRGAEFSESDLRFLTFLLSCFYRVPDDLLNIVESYIFAPGLVEDINSAKKTNLVDIIFSMFRAVAYPPRGGIAENPSPFSIDWHPNNPSKYNKFDLYRVDVVPMGRTGLRASGVKRLLMGKKDSRTYFFAFAEDHDFSDEIINIRTKSV